MAEQLGMAYNTVVKALKTIRGAIMANALDAAIIFDVGLGSSLGTARTKKTKKGPGGGPQRALVFGVIEQGGWVFVDLIPELTAEAVIHFKTNFHLKTATLGSIVYTDRYRHYTTLILCDPAISRLPHLRHRDKGLQADTAKGFWTYAKERLRRHQGIVSRHFPLYIKELEFRYNHRNEDIFPLLASYLCAFVPRLK
ncbi:MAG: transposase [Desulfovibrionaceae bacterium]